LNNGEEESSKTEAKKFTLKNILLCICWWGLKTKTAETKREVSSVYSSIKL